MDRIIISIAASCWLCGVLSLTVGKYDDKLLNTYFWKWTATIVGVFGLILFL